VNYDPFCRKSQRGGPESWSPSAVTLAAQRVPIQDSALTPEWRRSNLLLGPSSCPDPSVSEANYTSLRSLATQVATQIHGSASLTYDESSVLVFRSAEMSWSSEDLYCSSNGRILDSTSDMVCTHPWDKVTSRSRKDWLWQDPYVATRHQLTTYAYC
jgi:hypothetical protein